ncbi:unnamed protein product [Urochloa humidicola]
MDRMETQLKVDVQDGVGTENENLPQDAHNTERQIVVVNIDEYIHVTEQKRLEAERKKETWLEAERKKEDK